MKKETFISAYIDRMQKVEKTLMRIADELKKEGFTVYRSKTRVKFLEIVGYGKSVYVQYTEVPYCWDFSLPIPPTKGNGSSVHVDRIYSGPDELSTADVISRMQDVRITDREIESWGTFLIKH